MTYTAASGSRFSKPSFLKHQIVEIEIRQLANTLPAGSKLPAERTMAELYGCNFLTVRKALKRLVLEGMIERRIGSGTFVADKDSRSRPASKSQKQVGLLVHQHSDAYAHRLLQAIAHAALDLDVHVRSAWISDFGDVGVRLAETLAAGGCQSIVLPWFPSGSREDLRRFLAASPLPVCIPEPIPGFESQCFVNASAYGSNECTADLCAYFRQQGVGRIAF
jgi:DNA-binding transcriptional regulator YhcF (GntR family)